MVYGGLWWLMDIALVYWFSDGLESKGSSTTCLLFSVLPGGFWDRISIGIQVWGVSKRVSWKRAYQSKQNMPFWSSWRSWIFHPFHPSLASLSSGVLDAQSMSTTLGRSARYAYHHGRGGKADGCLVVPGWAYVTLLAIPAGCRHLACHRPVVHQVLSGSKRVKMQNDLMEKRSGTSWNIEHDMTNTLESL